MKQKEKREIYKAIVVAIIALAFVWPGEVVANDEKTNASSNVINDGTLDFTHTVFAEYTTETGCPPCSHAHAALKNIYAAGQYPFYYVSLVCDKNSIAYNRAKNDYNFYGYPTVFFDGGYKVVVGGGFDTQARYEASIVACGSRVVPDIDVELDVEWIDDATMGIAFGINNNEGSTYDGTIRVYITEVESSMEWRDTAGYLYTFSFLDWAFNEEISIPSGGTWRDSMMWNGSDHGYGSITKDNIMVIGAVFNDEWHQGYADPPSGRPFDAYYVDETNVATPFDGNCPEVPERPDGPTEGVVGVEYTFSTSTTDFDGDQVYYMWDWDDGTFSGWLGPYDSGETVYANHSWIGERKYDVKVKAKDVYGAESDWSYPKIIYIVNEGALEIGDISGGLFKVSAVIKNIGSVDMARVNWNINLIDGIILMGKETSGSIPNLPIGEEATISSDLILGFGKTVIAVSADTTGSSDTAERDAFVFLFFIKILNE